MTPPFAGYVSGHSAFSGAAAEFLQLCFGSDSFQGPSCNLPEEGKSLYEPRLVKGQAGYVAGLTDIPNTVCCFSFSSKLTEAASIINVIVAGHSITSKGSNSL